MNLFKKFIFTFFLLAILTAHAHASMIFASGAFKVGYGSTETTDGTTVPKTHMAAYAMDANLGVRMWGILLGANAEYSIWKQLTDPSSVSNINSQGKLTAVYPILGFEFSSFRLIGKFPSLLSGDYALDKTNSSSQSVKYKSASALILQLHWNITPLTFWGIEYQTLKFKKIDNAGTESDLTDAQKLKMSSIGILYGLNF